MRVDVWSDIVCPWCYIGKRRFERAVTQFVDRGDLRVVHRSFRLDSTSPPGTVRDHRRNLMAKYGLSEPQAADAQTRMERTAAEEGLELRLAGGVTGNTLDAHRLLQLAAGRAVQPAVLERLYRAHFTEQRSIFDVGSLAALGGEAGLDADEAHRVLRETTYGDAVAADELEARRLGVTGVPFVVVGGRYAVSGAQGPEVFANVLDLAWREAARL